MICAKCGQALIGAAQVEDEKLYHNWCAPSHHWGYGVPRLFPDTPPGTTFVSRAEVQRMIDEAIEKHRLTAPHHYSAAGGEL